MKWFLRSLGVVTHSSRSANVLPIIALWHKETWKNLSVNLSEGHLLIKIEAWAIGLISNANLFFFLESHFSCRKLGVWKSDNLYLSSGISMIQRIARVPNAVYSLQFCSFEAFVRFCSHCRGVSRGGLFQRWSRKRRMQWWTTCSKHYTKVRTIYALHKNFLNIPHWNIEGYANISCQRQES